jgi:predicted anti-sigma-YlaC factor YlaD
MKCEKAQERILTDYLDGAMAPEDQKGLEQHLEQCAACREFLALARQTAVTPFQEAARAPVSKQKVWQRLVDRITPETRLSEPGAGIREVWRGIQQVFTRPNIALAGVTLVLVLSLLMLWARLSGNDPSLLARQEEQQTEYVRYLLSDYVYEGYTYEDNTYEVVREQQDETRELDAYFL